MSADPADTQSHWTRHAAQWAQVGSPLRPTDEDVALYQAAIKSAPATRRWSPSRALLLGVTPELVAMPWPADARLFAVDSSLDMLRAVWAPGRFPGEHASGVSADWRALPLAAGTCDLVLGDGCLNILHNADDYRCCARELHRVLRADACVVLRIFCPPRVPESPGQVMDDLRRGKVGNFHAFKWRLVMAIHAADRNACLADVWACWEAEYPEPELAARLSGWSLGAIRTLEAYRNAAARYGFFDLDEIGALFAPEFELLDALRPGYELGERCPIVSFRRRAA